MTFHSKELREHEEKNPGLPDPKWTWPEYLAWDKRMQEWIDEKHHLEMKVVLSIPIPELKWSTTHITLFDNPGKRHTPAEREQRTKHIPVSPGRKRIEPRNEAHAKKLERDRLKKARKRAQEASNIEGAA